MAIETFQHKGLKRYFTKGDASKLPSAYLKRIARILNALDETLLIVDMDLPGYRLHELSGDLAEFWSVRVSGNYRIIFRLVIEGEFGIYDVDLIDYH